MNTSIRYCAGQKSAGFRQLESDEIAALRGATNLRLSVGAAFLGAAVLVPLSGVLVSVLGGPIEVGAASIVFGFLGTPLCLFMGASTYFVGRSLRASLADGRVERFQGAIALNSLRDGVVHRWIIERRIDPRDALLEILVGSNLGWNQRTRRLLGSRPVRIVQVADAPRHEEGTSERLLSELEREELQSITARKAAMPAWVWGALIFGTLMFLAIVQGRFDDLPSIGRTLQLAVAAVLAVGVFAFRKWRARVHRADLASARVQIVESHNSTVELLEASRQVWRSGGEPAPWRVYAE